MKVSVQTDFYCFQVEKRFFFNYFSIIFLSSSYLLLLILALLSVTSRQLELGAARYSITRTQRAPTEFRMIQQYVTIIHHDGTVPTPVHNFLSGTTGGVGTGALARVGVLQLFKFETAKTTLPPVGIITNQTIHEARLISLYIHSFLHD